MNILVTGANGQLGNELQQAVRSADNRWIFTDVAEGYEHLDITDASAVRTFVKANGIEMTINCAAYTNVNKAESDPDTADLLNNVAAGNLSEAMDEVQGTLVHISTDYVFHGDSNVPYAENMQAEPLGVYGRTKYAGEKAVINSGCRYLIIRTSWLYSSFGNNFVKTMLKLFSEKESVKVVFDQVGTPTYAGDLAEAIVSIVESGKLRDAEGIYHFSNEGVCSWYDFAKTIGELSGSACVIEPCHSEEFPSPVERPHYSVLDKTRIKSTFGLKIPYWRDSLAECLNKIGCLNKINDTDDFYL